jgi:hypothetical protein
MAKKLSLLFLIACLSFPALAQNRDTDSPFRFGLNFNPLLTWNRTGKNFKPDGVKAGFEYGLNVHYYFFKNVGIESGFYMNHHGAKFNYGNSVINNGGADTSSYNYKFNMNNIYAKIPVAFRFRTNLIGPIYLFGNFGVDFSFLVSSKLKFSGSDRNVHTEDGINIRYDYAEESYKVSAAPVRIGLFLGGGVEYPISGSFSITANLNYNYGFLNMVRDDMSSKKLAFVPNNEQLHYHAYKTIDKEDVRTQYLGLSVGVLF